jgi:predicted HicB family RNase H-like nuclease
LAANGFESFAREEESMERQLEAHRKAREIFETAPDWVTFFREVLGVEGIVRRMYSTAEALAEFEKTPQYVEIQDMLAKLREKNPEKTPETEPIRVITVRLPKSVHEALYQEATDHNTSVNQLCISKLLQMIEDDRVPETHAPRKPRKARHEETQVVGQA